MVLLTILAAFSLLLVLAILSHRRRLAHRMGGVDHLPPPPPTMKNGQPHARRDVET